MTYVISLMHLKGGVAKTTTALALAALFAEHQIETLLVDLDPQASLTIALGLDPAEQRYSAADFLLGNDYLRQTTRQMALPSLHLVPSNPDMLLTSKNLYLRDGYETLIRQTVLVPEPSHYKLIIIDCPAVAGPLNICALTASNLALIPTQCERFSIQALTSTLKLISVVRAKTNPGLPYRILATMVDRYDETHIQLLNGLRTVYKQSLLDTVINLDNTLRKSQSAGIPINLYDKSARATHQYAALALELQRNDPRQVLFPV